MAVHPFHRIGGGEWKTPSQHFVKQHAERVEVAPGIDRTVHSSGLLGGHIRKRTINKLGRFGKLAFAGKPRTDPEAHEPALAGIGRYKYVGRLDVLMDNSTSCR